MQRSLPPCAGEPLFIETDQLYLCTYSHDCNLSQDHLLDHKYSVICILTAASPTQERMISTMMSSCTLAKAEDVFMQVLGHIK